MTREFRDDLYSPSPGFLSSKCVDEVAIRKQQKTFVLDGTCAFLHVEAEEDVVVTPPVEWTAAEAGQRFESGLADAQHVVWSEGDTSSARDIPQY